MMQYRGAYRLHTIDVDDPRVLESTDAISAWSGKVEEKRKRMELYKQTETEQYTRDPKIATGPNKRFLVVRYGWYAFSFLLEEGEERGPALNQRAIELCKAMLVLQGDDTNEVQFRYEAEQLRDRYRRAYGRMAQKVMKKK